MSMFLVQMLNQVLLFINGSESVAILLVGIGLVASTVAARKFLYATKKEEQLHKTSDKQGIS